MISLVDNLDVPDGLALTRETLARKSLAHFVRLFWSTLEPGVSLEWGWHLDAICQHLQAVTEGRIRRLLINVPPRSGKSSIASVLWPAWEWLHNPASRWLTGSYDRDLATRDSVRSRRVMQSDLYQRLLATGPDHLRWTFSSDQNVKSRFENSKMGTRFSTAVEAGATGEGGERILIDDALNASEIGSESALRAVREWVDRTMFTRQNNLKTSSIVVVGQRLAQGDITDHLLDKKNYEILCLPLEFERDHPNVRTTSIGWSDPRTREGELLMPDRIGPDEVKALKVALGPQGYAAQYQQRPSPAAGLMFQRADFRRWKQLPAKFDFVAQSWDLSFKGIDDRRGFQSEARAVTEPAYVVGDIWGFKGADAYLIDEVREQADIVRTIEMILSLTLRHPKARKILIENKANGPAVYSMLKARVPGLHMVEPQGSKIERARACQPYVSAGNIWIPDGSIAPWADDWLEEICGFPAARYKDRIDAMGQALLHGLGPEKQNSLERLLKMTRGVR